MKESGQDSTKASEEERQRHRAPQVVVSGDLPWSDKERLLHGETAAAGDVEGTLFDELTAVFRPSAKKERLQTLEQALRPMYVSLPKDGNGHLRHSVVRYALHRLFLQLHGWFIRGLEPAGDTWHNKSMKEWVPSYLQGFLERHLGERGFTLSETAVVAATLEDLIHKEAIERLEGIYKILGFSIQDDLDAQQATLLVNAYMMTYITGSKADAQNAAELSKELRAFYKSYTDWVSNERWLRQPHQRVRQGIP